LPTASPRRSGPISGVPVTAALAPPFADAARSRPRTATSAVIAAERVHPVPCVFAVATRGWVNSRTRPSRVARMSVTSPSLPCPPLRRTAPGPRSSRRSAWSRIWSGVCASGSSSDRSRAASGRLGVMRSATGSRWVRTASTASDFEEAMARGRDHHRVDGVEARAGLRRRGRRRGRRVHRPPSIPDFDASTGMSPSTESNWSATKSIVDRVDPGHPVRVLGDEGGDDARAHGLARGEGLEVGVDSGSPGLGSVPAMVRVIGGRVLMPGRRRWPALSRGRRDRVPRTQTAGLRRRPSDHRPGRSPRPRRSRSARVRFRSGARSAVIPPIATAGMPASATSSPRRSGPMPSGASAFVVKCHRPDRCRRGRRRRCPGRRRIRRWWRPRDR
jgi:hypothetical protein